MKSLMITVAAALLSAPLYAQEVTASSPSTLRAADNALEITLGAGYAQGFGDIGANQRNLTDQSSAGGELQLGVGYRINPNFMVGTYGSGSVHATGDYTTGGNVYTATAGLQTNYHFLPTETWDPWIGVGSGWRALWINHANGGTDTRHGLDIARVTAGVDYRVNSQFALSPYVGAGVTTFLTQELAADRGFSNVSSPKASVWIFGGLQGRFDVLGNTNSSSMRVASAN